MSSAVDTYTLVVAQLLDDGFVGAAQAVAAATHTPLPLPAHMRPPPRELERLLQLVPKDSLRGAQVAALDLDAPTPEGADAPQPLSPVWSSKHSGRAVSFSPDGRRAAVGALDGAIKVLDVRAMMSTARGGAASGASPIERTYTDHSNAVNDLVWHPSSALLVSASEDGTMRFFEMERQTLRATRQCTDTHAVRSVSFHPAGDHLLVGTAHSALHIYDVASFRCYTAARPNENHTSPITSACWSSDGSLFASCAADSIKLWDANSCRCVHTLENHHSGQHVSAIKFSSNGRYLLSCGLDSRVCLFSVASAKVVCTYEGASQQTHPTSCCFSHNEACVLSADETTNDVLAWNARSGDLLYRCTGHTGSVTGMAHSPVEPALLTLGDDTVRCWAPADAHMVG